MKIRGLITVSSVIFAAGCATDYVTIRPNPGGFIQQRAPTARDKYLSVMIGAKQYQAYRWDSILASETESRRLTRELGLCPNGYTVRADPKIMGGDYGYLWSIICND